MSLTVYFQGSAITMTETAKVTLDAPMEKINLHIREGSILPLQQPNTTTYASRKNGFELRAAVSPKTGTANGYLYWDDGDTIGKGIYINCKWCSYCERVIWGAKYPFSNLFDYIQELYRHRQRVRWKE